MSKKIKYEKMTGSERAYRVMMIVTYIVAALTVVSCVFVVPGIDVSGSSPWLVVYSALYAVYFLMLAACAVLAYRFFVKTRKDYAAIQAGMLGISAVFTAANVKMFLIFFLYGIGKDSKVEELFGTDMDSLTQGLTSGWVMLIIAFSVTMLLGVLSIIRLAARKYS